MKKQRQLGDDLPVLPGLPAIYTESSWIIYGSPTRLQEWNKARRSAAVIMNKINPVVMQMFHEDCQWVEENLPPAPSPMLKTNNSRAWKTTRKEKAGAGPPGSPARVTLPVQEDTWVIRVPREPLVPFTNWQVKKLYFVFLIFFIKFFSLVFPPGSTYGTLEKKGRLSVLGLFWVTGSMWPQEKRK